MSAWSRRKSNIVSRYLDVCSLHPTTASVNKPTLAIFTLPDHDVFEQKH